MPVTTNEELIEKAKSVINPRRIGDYLVGDVGCALVTVKNNAFPRFLTVAEVIEINAKVLGGSHALRDRGLLESAVARPQAGAFGGDAYPDLVPKAAALLYSMRQTTPRITGSKQS